jgi:hypothetical protein
MLTQSPRYRRREASQYLREKHGIYREPTTLAKYVSVGGGPAYQKANRTPLYTPEDLDAWVESILSPKVANTSQLKNDVDEENCDA